MQVLVISANTERLNMPTMPLGAGLVVAAARAAGYRTELLDLMLEADPLAAVRQTISRLDPRVIGVSIRNIDDQDMASPTFLLEKAGPVVDICKWSGATVVLGGAGYSIFPAAALAYLGADAGIRGDGEAAFVEVLARLEAGQPLDEQVARFARRGFEQFYVVDNTFNRPEAHALEVCRLLEPLGVRWRCIIYPHKVSAELVSAMGRAGCVEVALGFESGSQPVLDAMNKHYTPADVKQVCAMLTDAGIRRVGFLLLGGPGETRETVEQSLAFADSLEFDALRTTVGIRIYPDTPLAQRALEEGVITPGDDLLRPRFYLSPGLGPWIYERVIPGFRTC